MNQINAQKSTGAAPAGSRLAELERCLAELERDSSGARSTSNAVAMLFADAALDADDVTLSAGQRSLKSIYGRLLSKNGNDERTAEKRGHVLAYLDLLQWLLRRAAPPADSPGLEPNGQARRLLEYIAERPGESNHKLAEVVGTDMTSISRLGRRLLDAGLVRRRRLGRTNHWEITPRGLQTLKLEPVAPRVLDRVVVKRLAQHMIEVSDVRERGTVPAKWLPVAGRVLATLLANRDPLSPADVAARTNLSKRVVAAAAAFLMEAGYLSQDGRADLSESAFLPDLTRPLSVNADKYCAIGIKILPGRLVGVMTDLNDLRSTEGREIRSDLADAQPEAVIAAITDLVDDLRNPSGGAEVPRYILGVGIELGGHVDSKSGEVVFSPNLGWEHVELGSRVQEATGLQTVVENDVNALAVHEQLVGTAVDVDYFAAILLDEGIGSGLILDGQLMRGRSGLAGELGHIIVEPQGEACRCGKRGCLETVASVRGILNRIADARQELPATLEDAAVLAEQSDRAACDAFAAAGEALGRAVSTLQNITNVERILIAVPSVLDPKSDRFAGEVFRQRFYAVVSSSGFSTASSDCMIEIRHLVHGDRYGAQGAASTVVRKFVRGPLTWRPVLTRIGGGENLEAAEHDLPGRASADSELGADFAQLLTLIAKP